MAATAQNIQSLNKQQVKQPVPCPICNSTRFSIIYHPTVEVTDPAKIYGAASGIPGTQTIVQCLDCPMIYENPRFSEEAIIAGYSASNDAGHDTQHAMRRRSFLNALRSVKGRIPAPGSKILDVGTAGGAFLEAAEEFGYEAWGLEPSKFLVDQGKSRGLKIEQGTIAQNGFQEGTFDMITLWDVLEHLPEPRKDLEAIRKLLKPNGKLLINYPDIGTIQAKLAGKRFWWLISVHLTHFNRDSIREICKRTGFEVEHFQRYWQILEFGYLQNMAIHFKFPLAKLFKSLTPSVIQSIPIPYYASQTTCIARCR